MAFFVQFRIHPLKQDRTTVIVSGRATMVATCAFCLLHLGLTEPNAATQVRAQGFSPVEAASRMTVADGLRVKLFASEPQIRQPILVKCDDRGRLWVIQYLQYPNPAGLKRVSVDRWSRTVYDRVPEPPPDGPVGEDRITILEDTDGDGKADRFTDFVRGLNLATGLAFGDGGVYVLQVPYLLFYPDRDRDDVPDSRPQVLLQGFGMEDAQSLANHLTWGPDGWLYGVNGSTTTCNVRGIEFQQGVWRYHPLLDEFELFCEGGGNLFGLTFDEHGNLFYSSNGGYLFFHGVQGGYYQKSFGKHGPLHNPFTYGFFGPVHKPAPAPGAPSTGGTIYLGDAFPASLRGRFLCGDFLGHTVSWWRVEPRGSTFQATRGGTLLDAHDTWFGPTDLALGPDGSVFVSDFCDQRTAHPDPDAEWDRTNGRVYKIEGAAARPVQALDLSRLGSNELVELLRHKNRWFAQRARMLLAQRRDPVVRPALEQLAFQQADGRLALQGLWGLHVSGGLNDDIARRLLEHAEPCVRSWTVRLLGDRRTVSPAVSHRLCELARTDPSVAVRSQLASTAKRLPARDGLPIVMALIERNADEHDPFVPSLVWWALEDKAISDLERVVPLFTDRAGWKTAAGRDNARRLMRRYAAQGTKKSYMACLQLLQAAPYGEQLTMLAALNEGLSERARPSGTVGQGGLFENYAAVTATAGPPPRGAVPAPLEALPAELSRAIAGFWNDDPASPLRLRLAIQAEDKDAYQYLLKQLRGGGLDRSRQIELLTIAAELGREDCVESILPSIAAGVDQQVLIAALRAVQPFQDKRIAERVLSVYPLLSADLRSRCRDLLFTRATWARQFLQLVSSKAVPADEVPVEQLRRLTVHGDDELQQLIQRHWGTVRPGTPEEKLAVMRRLNNDLRAGTGDVARGAELFQRHCETCHRLFDRGNSVGPDLTSANRQDATYLLASLVDPSAVVRAAYVGYIATTVNGQVVEGLLAEQDAASVTLLDAKNQRIRIPRDQLESLTESRVSLMPERLLETLKPQELRDLFAYLQRATPLESRP